MATSLSIQMDPIMARGEKYTEKCDVFSFALILMQCLTAKPLKNHYPENLASIMVSMIK